MANFFRKFVFTLALTATCAGVGRADAKFNATASSEPSPMNLCEPCVITIKPVGDLGDEVYIFSWPGNLAGQVGYNMGWNDAIADKYRMTRQADGSYTYTLTESYQEWFKISDEQAEGLTEIGVIARSATQQTVDCMLPCVFKKTYFSGGEGSASDPYRISTADDLVALSSSSHFWSADCHFIQKDNIELEGRFSPIGTAKTPFCGTYNGDGYSITNLEVNRSNASGAGLFGVADGATITGVVLVGANVSGQGYVGSLAGQAINCTISESLSSGGTVKSSMPCAGGLVGVNEKGTISNCYSTTAVEAKAEKAVSGLVGKNTGKISNSYSTGTVLADNYGGGITGANYGTVHACVAINAAVNGAGAFIGRMGGNNNALNISEDNLSWSNIPHTNLWSDFADHSLRSDLHPENEATYKNALNWDFNNVWIWKTKDDAGYPDLRIVKADLPNPLPEEFVKEISALPSLFVDDNSTVVVYNLQGIFVGNSLDNLPSGIYIVRKGTESFKLRK